MKYSVIIPVYNEAESIMEMAERISNVLKSMTKEEEVEILFVDDGSTDGSKDVLRKMCSERPNIKSIFFRKNSGKSTALSAGFIYAKGEIIITIDGDLQDCPEDIPKLIEKLDEGYDLVSGWKTDRKDSVIRRSGSYIFNLVVSWVGGLRLHDFNCGFKAYRSKVANAVTVYGQYHRLIPLLVHLMGFRVGEVSVANDARKFGTSKYPAFRYQGFFDLLSILFTYKYRFSPLYFFGFIGLILIIPSLASLFHLILRHTLYVLGLGDNYMAKITLLLPLSTSFFVVGINIFLTGFVCDFILSHKKKIDIRSSVEEMIEVESVEE